MSRTETGDLTWDRYDIASVHLSHVAALLLSQGLAVSELFPTNGSFLSVDGYKGGPFYYIAGEPVVGDVPPRITKVVLARIVEAPEGVSMTDVLGRIVETVLTGR